MQHVRLPIVSVALLWPTVFEISDVDNIVNLDI